MPQALGNVGIVTETKLLKKTYAYSSLLKTTITDIPLDKDIVAIGMELTGAASTGAATPVKKVDNPAGILQEFTLNGDGDPILNLRDTEHLWYHHMFWSKMPMRRETPVAPNVAAQPFFLRTIIPVGLRIAEAPFKEVTIDLEWGDAATNLDSSANFAITTTPILSIVLYRGQSLRSFFTKRHTDTVNGDGQRTIPRGQLIGAILNVTDQSDSIDTITLEDRGSNVKDYNFEVSVMDVNQLYDIDFGYYGSVEVAAAGAVGAFEKYRRDGITILDMAGVVSDGVNTFLKYKTTASKTLDILYIYEGRPTPR
jgi:hypothetical protein